MNNMIPVTPKIVTCD